MASDPRGNADRAVKITGETVILSVGSDAAKLIVHEQTIRSRSDFFDAALDKCWKEAQDRRISLPDDKADIVQRYCQYLYSEKIYLTPTIFQKDVAKDTNLLPEYLVLAELYVFGEKIGDIPFKDAVIDAFLCRRSEPVEGVRYSPITSAVDILYEGTMPGSPARRLMVDRHVRLGASHWISDKSEDQNKEFLMDLARTMLQIPRPLMSTANLDRGDYHENEGGSGSRKRPRGRRQCSAGLSGHNRGTVRSESSGGRLTRNAVTLSLSTLLSRARATSGGQPGQKSSTSEQGVDMVPLMSCLTSSMSFVSASQVPSV
ncbi:hypothetical protein LTR85_010695 [Meristemomyces frigidus]|nr:hypothetical protein LTR85_010695 [Meristemomyces frigidus]